MRKKKFFQNFYKYDENTQSYLIEVSLDNYDDVYDEWDPSPFKLRDIEDEFHDFVVNSSEDIPINHAISLVLYLPAAKQDAKKESNLISAYRNYYQYEMERLYKKKENLRNKNFSYLTFSLLLLTIYFLWDTFSSANTGSLLSSPLKEGIMIGGWVFLWEVFTNLFIKRKELVQQLKTISRLHEAEVRFIYQN